MHQRREDVIDMDSSTARKFSRHLVIKLNGGWYVHTHLCICMCIVCAFIWSNSIIGAVYIYIYIYIYIYLCICAFVCEYLCSGILDWMAISLTIR
jgi:hypothetical protein